MRIFLTGSNGFIGSQLVTELLQAGHQVLGMTRSEAGARALEEAGAEVFRGNLEDLDSLREGAARSDGVIHTAFDHDFSNFPANCQKDGRAIAAMGSVLEGSDRLMLITSGTAMGCAKPGQPATEDFFDPHHPNPRVASELAGLALSERGVNVSVVRLSQIHNTVKQGLITEVIALARQKGFSAYVEEGLNCWSAAHVTDTARLYRLALEKQQAGVRYNATAEGAIRFRDIAVAIGKTLDLPVTSIPAARTAEHFGWMAAFADKDMSASSSLTEEMLGWYPRGPGLLADLENLQR